MDYKSNIIKMSFFTQIIYRFDANTIKTPKDIFFEPEKLVQKFI